MVNLVRDLATGKLGNLVLEPTDVKSQYESNADTNAFTDAEQTKLAGVESGATADQTGAEIKALYEAEADTNAFTDAEKSKLAGLEGSHYKGLFTSLANLQAGVPSPVAGDYGDVDLGTSNDVVRYIWDVDDTQWVEQLGESSALTASQVKTLYESNANTNEFDDAEKSKLASLDPASISDGTSNVSVDSTDGPVSIDTNGVNRLLIDDDGTIIHNGGSPDATLKGAGVNYIYTDGTVFHTVVATSEADHNLTDQYPDAKMRRAVGGSNSIGWTTVNIGAQGAASAFHQYVMDDEDPASNNSVGISNQFYHKNVAGAFAAPVIAGDIILEAWGWGAGNVILNSNSEFVFAGVELNNQGYDGDGPIKSEVKTQTSVTTSNNTATPIYTFAIPADSEAIVEAKIHGHEDVTDDHAWSKLTFCAKNVGGTTTLVGGVDEVTGYDAGASAWDFTVVINGSNEVEITVTGENSKTIDWVCHFHKA